MSCETCGEEHREPRGLSFDGRGINSCGMYRVRLATFTNGLLDHIPAKLGPMFAAAPELLAALSAIVRQCEASTDPDVVYVSYKAIRRAEEAIRKAEGVNPG